MKPSSTDAKESSVVAPPVQGIHIDLFKNFTRLTTSPRVQRNADRGPCNDPPNDCDCECAPQCPDCGPTF